MSGTCPKPIQDILKTYSEHVQQYPKHVKVFVNACPEHIQHVSRTFSQMSKHHKLISWNSSHLLKLLSSVGTVVIRWNSCLWKKWPSATCFLNTSSCWGFVYNESPGTLVVCWKTSRFWSLRGPRARRPPGRPARAARAARAARSARYGTAEYSGSVPYMNHTWCTTPVYIYIYIYIY